MKLQIRKSTAETDLIKACKKQNSKAQSALYDKFAPPMLGLCKRYIIGEMEAEDVMINGFMKVFTKIEASLADETQTFEQLGEFLEECRGAGRVGPAEGPAGTVQCS